MVNPSLAQGAKRQAQDAWLRLLTSDCQELAEGMAIRDLVTLNNVLDYARAGIAVARTFTRLRPCGYGTGVIPSRGAVPVMHIARHYYRSMVRPYMSARDRASTWDLTQLGPLTLDFQAPFTADVGDMGIPGLQTSHVRAFWARVIAAIVRGDVNHPSYRLYRFVRDEVCPVGHHDDLEWRMRSERFIFVDTVVSGQAICEIVDAFNAEGLEQIHYVLLLDQNGAQMKKAYASRVHALAQQGRATLIKVPCLFTEDQGPAVSGIWSVVVPRLMELAREDSLFQDGIVGAGLYYTEIRQRKDGSNLPITQSHANLYGMLFQAMHAAANPDHVAEDLDALGVDLASDKALMQLFETGQLYAEYLDFQVERYVDHIEDNRLFHQGSTEKFALPRIADARGHRSVDLDASSSHCLRLNIGQEEAAAMMRQFKASLSKPYWANAERTLRA